MAKRVTLVLLVLSACRETPIVDTGRPDATVVLIAPDVEQVAPSRSPLAGGGTALLRGVGFQSGATIDVGGAASKSVTVVSRQLIAFTLPSGRPGPADLTVENPDGGKATLAQAITYEPSASPAPTLAHITPNTGPMQGGTYALVEGTGLLDGALLLVGGRPATQVAVLSSTQLVALIPPTPTAGTANVVVTNPDGQSGALLAGFAYASSVSAKAPHLASLAPTEGPLAGGTAGVVSASDVAAGGWLYVGGVPTPFTAASGALALITPKGAHPGLADLAVTNPDGQSDVLPGAFNYYEPPSAGPTSPRLTRVAPARSPLAGGGTVLIAGAGFAPGASVLFGMTPAMNVVVAGDGAITCTVPRGDAGAVNVTVKNADGGAVTFTGGFTYADSTAAAPTLSAASPNGGLTSGGTLTLLAGAALQPGALVFVGGRPATEVTVVSANAASAFTPAHDAGTADVVLTNPDGQSATLAGAFAYSPSASQAAPVVTAVAPAGGPLEGGTAVLVSGQSFVPGLEAFVGGRPASVTPQGTGAFVLTTPAAGAPGLADVSVTNPDGQTATLAAAFNYYVAGPLVASIAPACGPVTGGADVTVYGRNFRPGVTVSLGGVALGSLVRADAQTLAGATPVGFAGTGDVVVQNPDGQKDVLAGGFTFTDDKHPCPGAAQVPLALRQLIPANGPSTGGTILTLVGDGFAKGLTVKLGGAAATDVALLGPGTLTLTLPPGPAGPTDVTLALADGRATTLKNGFVYFDATSNAPPPSLTSLAPNAGPNTGATVALVTGAGFASGARVFFGGVEAELPTLVDATRLVAVTPASLPGPVDVLVVNPDGKSATLQGGFAYYQPGLAGPPPLAQKVVPRTGSTASATTVAVQGSAFAAGALVFVGGVPATGVQLQSDGSLAATLGPQPAGTVDVVVTNPDGQSSTLTGAFTFSAPAPKLAAVTPAFGPLAGGVSVVVTGAGFAKGDVVLFDGQPAAGKLLDAGTFFVVAPAHAAAKVDVVLSRNGEPADTLAAAFEYRAGYSPGPQPSLSALRPATGPTTGATVLWLTGAHLDPLAQIFFGAAPAAGFVWVDASHAIVTTPPGAAGTADVTAFNPDGQSTALLRGFSYVDPALLAGPAPRLSSATPDHGPESGATVDVLTGGGFAAGELVFVGKALGSGVKLLSASILTTTFPPQPAGQVDLAVTHPDGRSAVLRGGFTYLARPTIVSVVSAAASSAGPTAGGTALTVAGSGFEAGATLTFGSALATSVQVLSSTVITAVTPPGSAGPADVQLVNPDGQSAVLTGGWLYVAPPAATALTPSTGPAAGGTIAVLTGQNLTSGTTVSVGGNLAKVTYGTPTTLIVTVPGGAAGNAPVVVANPDGQYVTLGAPFTYVAHPSAPAPALTSIAPPTGPDTGASLVLMAGANFAPGALAIVGVAPLARVNVLSAAALTGLTGAGAPGAALMAVTNPDGQSATLASGYTYVDHTTLSPPPAIDHLVPNSALASGGAGFAVLGKGFSKGAMVFLGGAPASVSNYATSGAEVDATTPPANAGIVDAALTNADGQTSLATGAFTFLVPPPLFASSAPVTPASGPTAGGTNVAIKGNYFLPPVQVYFGSSPAKSITSATSSEIDVVSPPGIAGSVAILVKNADGQPASLPGAFAYQPPPLLLGLAPTSGDPAGGNVVHLTGRYFLPPVTVSFGQASAAVASSPAPTATDIVVTAPASSAAGSLNVAVTVTNADSQSVTLPGAYVYLPPAKPPTVTGVTPSAGPQAGGNTVTVLGTSFQYGAQVFFGADTTAPAGTSVVVTSTGALTCTVPSAKAAGKVSVTVVNPDTNSATLPNAYAYTAGAPLPSLKLSSISPVAGDVAGGTPVLIAGTGLQPGATVTLVASNGGATVSLVNALTIGPTALTGLTPPQPAGTTGATFAVVVKNPDGTTDQLANAWSYGTGRRHFRPVGLRMPMESSAGKSNRGVSGRSTPSWSGVIAGFTQSHSGVADAFIGGYNGHAPRLLQGTTDPLGTNAIVYRDLSSNLKNPNGTPVTDNCCGTNNSGTGITYNVFEPRTYDFDGNGWPDVAFFDDGQNRMDIFFNNAGTLTARTFGLPGGINDWVGGADALGHMIDFNLDGYPDFAFAVDGREYVMMSCGTAGASPFCSEYNNGGQPYLPSALSAGTQTSNLNSAPTGDLRQWLKVGQKLLVDSGANQETVTISAVAQTTFTATFANAHPSGVTVATFINTTSSTAVTTPGGQWLTVADVTGFGGNSIVTLEPGGANEEILTGWCGADFSTSRVCLYPTLTHGAGFKLQTGNPHLYVYDPTRFPAGITDNTFTIVAGDIDGDGDIDVMTGNDSNGGVRVYLNNAAQLKAAGKDPNAWSFTDVTNANGNQTFSGNVIGGNVHALTLADFNGDGQLDLLVGYDSSPGSSPQGQQERLWMNHGGGVFVDETLQAQALVNGSYQAVTCASGGRNRVPTAVDAVLRYEVKDLDGKNGPDVLAWVDVNGSKSSNTFQRALRLWLNDGSGCLVGEPTDFTTGGITDSLFPSTVLQTWDYAFGDLNGDGLPDLLAGFDDAPNGGGRQSREYVNLGGAFVDRTASNWPEASSPTTTNKWYRYTTGALLTDVNGDGFPDLVVSQFNAPPRIDCCWSPLYVPNDGVVRVFFNDQKGNFPHDNSATAFPTMTAPWGATMTDLPLAALSMDAANLLGKGQDLVIGSSTEWTQTSLIPYPVSSNFYNQWGSVHLMLNNGDGTYSDGTYPRLPPGAETFSASAVKFVDLDLDGNMDIVVGTAGANGFPFGSVRIWQNTGTGYFVDVTSTALSPSTLTNPYGPVVVHQLLTGNFDGDAKGLPDVVVVRDGSLRLLINHSNPATHQILLLDETELVSPIDNNQARIQSPPSAISAAVGDYDCNGTPDLYVIDQSGGEHVLVNEACLDAAHCGHFADASTAFLPPASKGQSCIGTDCGGNQAVVSLSYDSQHSDVMIIRRSDDNTVRPHRLLKNTCSQFQELSQASWQPLPTDNDKAYGAVVGNIFGHTDASRDVLILNEWGPRIYQNQP